LIKPQCLEQKILLNAKLNKKTTDILFSAEKGHQMMPFLLLVRQILFKIFPKSLANS